MTTQEVDHLIFIVEIQQPQQFKHRNRVFVMYVCVYTVVFFVNLFCDYVLFSSF